MSDEPTAKGLVDLARNYITLYAERCATPSRKAYRPYDWTTLEVLAIMERTDHVWSKRDRPDVIEQVLDTMKREALLKHNTTH